MNTPTTGSVAERYSARRPAKNKKLLFGVALATVTALGLGGVFLSKQFSAAPESELNIGMLLEPTNLNIRETSGAALEQILLDNVYQGLITLSSGKIDEFEPALATALPEISADGRSYRFQLRDNVKFHDGSALDTDDVVASLQTTLAKLPQLEQPQVSANPDTNEITIELAAPNQQLLWHLAGKHGVILDSAQTTDLTNSANGTGPYKFANWQQGSALTLTANPDYWGEKATIATVNFKFVTDSRAAANAITSGALDVHTALLPSLREELSKAPGVRLERAASTDVFTLAYNSAKAPFNNPEVRAALSQAIDTAALIDSQFGDGQPLGSPITALEPGYSDLTAVNSYNPAAAKKRLAELGVAGTKLTITAPNFYDQAPLDIIATQLRAAGVEVELERVEFSVWLERVYTNHDFDLSYVNHAEPRDFANYANPEYYFGYNSATVQQLSQQALHQTDSAKAAQLLEKAAATVAADAPAKWLYNYTPTLVLTDRVAQFPLSNTNSRLNLAAVTLK